MGPEAMKIKEERDALRVALREAIGSIQIFHGPGWELYRDFSPEMKRWRALLDVPTEWTEREEAVIADLMGRQELSRRAVLRQGLRLFQMYVEGAIKLPIDEKLKLCDFKP